MARRARRARGDRHLRRPRRRSAASRRGERRRHRRSTRRACRASPASPPRTRSRAARSTSWSSRRRCGSTATAFERRFARRRSLEIGAVVGDAHRRSASCTGARVADASRPRSLFVADANTSRRPDGRRHDAAPRARGHHRAAVARAAGPEVDLRAVHSPLGANRSCSPPACEVACTARSICTIARGAVFVANHVSWFDIFALASELPWCSFVAKTELRRIPLFGFAAEAAGIVFLDRENRKQAFESYEVAAKEVQRGRASSSVPRARVATTTICVRSRRGRSCSRSRRRRRSIPTVVYGAREVMPKGSFWIRVGGTIDLHFLEPVPTTGYDYEHRAELMTATWTAMAETLARRVRRARPCGARRWRTQCAQAGTFTR